MTKDAEAQFINSKSTYLRGALHGEFDFTEEDIETMKRNIQNDFPIFNDTPIGNMKDELVAERKGRLREEDRANQMVEENSRLIEDLEALRTKLREAARFVYESEPSRARYYIGGDSYDWITFKLEQGLTLSAEEIETVKGYVNPSNKQGER